MRLDAGITQHICSAYSLTVQKFAFLQLPVLYCTANRGISGTIAQKHELPPALEMMLLMVQGCQMAKFYPFLSLDCPRVEGMGAQSKERKGSNFAA